MQLDYNISNRTIIINSLFKTAFNSIATHRKRQICCSNDEGELRKAGICKSFLLTELLGSQIQLLPRKLINRKAWTSRINQFIDFHEHKDAFMDFVYGIKHRGIYPVIRLYSCASTERKYI